jgi:thiamine-phosphate pyrophosphorylase
MKNFDPRLYLVTDRPLCRGREIMDIVSRAVSGGASMVQLREKQASTREFVELARAVLRVLIGTNVPLIINDRMDVALCVGAQGVHVGQSDMHVLDVRAMLGPDAVVGLSVETMEQVRKAQDWPVDYLGLGPVFATKTKADAGAPWGLDGLASACAQSRIPIVAIGSMSADSAHEARKAGAAGVAVVSALCSAPSPSRAAAEILASWERGGE